MTRSFGVAVGLPEPYTSELQTWRERLGDPNAAGIPPHVTLLPPTALPDPALPEVERHLRDVAAAGRAFEVHLSGSHSFRPLSPVVFVPLAAGGEQCGLLQHAVRSGPLSGELAFPYHPHVTVAHDLDDAALDRAHAALAEYEARFTVWGFTLFEQDRRGVWCPQRDFGFGSGALPHPVEPPGLRAT